MDADGDREGGLKWWTGVEVSTSAAPNPPRAPGLLYQQLVAESREGVTRDDHGALTTDGRVNDSLGDGAVGGPLRAAEDIHG